MEYVKNGGNVYFTYEESRASLNAYFNGLFGVEVQSSDGHGIYKSFKLKKDWECLKDGTEITVTNKDNSEYLKVKAKEAKVIAEFADGMPAVTVNELGRGKAYLVTYPIENNLMNIQYDSFIENGIFKLYDSLLENVGIKRPVKSSNHRIEIGLMENEKDNEYLLICINHDISPAQARLYFDKSLTGKTANIFDVFNKRNVPTGIDESGDTFIDAAFEEAGVNAYKLL